MKQYGVRRYDEVTVTDFLRKHEDELNSRNLASYHKLEHKPAIID